MYKSMQIHSSHDQRLRTLDKEWMRPHVRATDSTFGTYPFQRAFAKLAKQTSRVMGFAGTRTR